MLELMNIYKTRGKKLIVLYECAEGKLCLGHVDVEEMTGLRCGKERKERMERIEGGKRNGKP